MPYKWVKPEVSMSQQEAGGETPVYCAYENDMWGDPLHFGYQLDLVGERTFDVRELAGLLNGVEVDGGLESHKAAIRAAVEAFGSLDLPVAILRGEVEEWNKKPVILDSKSNDVDSDGTRTGVAHFRADGQETLCGRRLGDYQVVRRATQILFVCPECLEVVGGDAGL